MEQKDDNRAIAEIFGYEGDIGSDVVRITFSMPKKEFAKLSPAKFGDVFGIENLTNKEGIR